MVKLGEYNTSKQAQDTIKDMELKMLRDNLRNVIVEIEEKILPDVVDMADTFDYLFKNDKEFNDNLWRNYLTKSDEIDVNSYFGFCAEGSDYYHHIAITRYGVGCYYDNKKYEFKKDNWRHPHDIKDELEIYDKEQLEKLLNSAMLLIAYMPAYIEGFFKCVSDRKVNKD